MNLPAENKKSQCDPPPPIRSHARCIAGVLALLMSLLGLWMAIDLKSYPCEHAFYKGIDSPVLAVELASDVYQLRTVTVPACAAELSNVQPQDQGKTLAELQSKSRSALWRNTVQDCFFIPLYTLFVWTFGKLFAVRKNGSLMAIRHVLGFLMLLTAAADYLENRGIFLGLRLGPSDSVAEQTSWPSRCKWALLGIGLLLIFAILVRSANAIYSLATRRLFALGCLASGGMILAGLWRPVLIELAMKLFVLIVLLNTIALLGPYWPWGAKKPDDLPESILSNEKA
jgi:hypothetical protein